jgi:ribosomal protein S12 methylthiotransferase
LIKGPYRSRPASSIIKEAQYLASRKVKEINLVSQDTTYYGKDKGLKDGLPLLLGKLVKIKGIEWIRILYGYPEEISDSLMEVMKESKICPYLDIPFQHSNPSIIKEMKRAMDGRRALKLIQKIRNRIPDIALRTSLLVGFPGEGKKEFEDLKKFVREAKFDHLGVFVYSLEEGTSAFPSGNPLEEKEKNKRKKKIMEIQADISYQKNSRYLNKQMDVLIEGTLKEDPKVLVGRTKLQAPEVDGVVFIPYAEKLSNVVNTIQKVEINDCDIYDLYGRVIQ